MKRTVFLSIVLFLCCSHARSQDSCGISWGSVVQISHDSAFSVVPQLLALGDTVHLLWFGDVPIGGGVNFGLGIQYSRSTDGGQTFSAQRQLASYDSARGNRGFLAASGRYIYMKYIARVYSPIYDNLGILRSTDAGLTWEPRRVLGDVNARAITARDSSVYIYFYYVDGDTARSGLFFSHDYGVTWDSVHLPFRIRAASFVRLATSAKALHMTRQRGINGAQEIFYNRSSDFGYTWSSDDTLSLLDGWESQNARITSDGNGNLYVVWNDGKYGGDFSGTIVMRCSTDDGLTWLPEQIISQLATAGFCDVSVEDSQVAVVWDTEITYYIHMIESRISLDRGSSWCNSNVVASSGGDPAVSNALKRLHAAWPDSGEIYYRQGVNGPVSVEEFRGLPKTLTLYQNYPNPFNSRTVIRYSLPVTGYVTLKVYNVLGQAVATLLDGRLSAGEHVLTWDADDVSTGIYFYSLTTESFTQTKKLILLK